MINNLSYKVGILALLLLTVYQPFYAQKIVKTTGSAQVRMEQNMTKNDALALAEQQAMIDAIEKVFGTYVEQQTDMSAILLQFLYQSNFLSDTVWISNGSFSNQYACLNFANHFTMCFSSRIINYFNVLLLLCRVI